MLLTETIKNFLTPHTYDKHQSSFIDGNRVLNNLSDTSSVGRFNDFFDSEHNTSSWNNNLASDSIVNKQASKIKSYRECALQAEVTNAIDIIVNEIVFTYEKFPLKLQYNDENEKIQEAMQKAFNKLVTNGNFFKNLYDVVRRSYIDGQLVCQCVYDKTDIKKGIQKLRMIDPVGLYFDPKTQTWKYDSQVSSLSGSSPIYYNNYNKDIEYSIEEIVRVDFGIYQDNICLSYLEHGIKIANMLRCLEDMLIPLRFSRSISRRVFNVDIGDLPAKRGEEYMKKVQDAFKYKKFYNNETGEISNQQHITSMVEDYWFANRSGGRGTTVDTIDETGNLGEITDVLYFNKKLYRALHIPTAYLDIDDSHPFSTDATESTQDDVKFMMFVSRLRLVYCEFFKELLKREVIATKVMSEKTWNTREHDINIMFANENLFIEKMKLSILKDKIEAWNDAKEIGGTVFSFKELLSRVFGFNEAETNSNLEKIKEEALSGAFKKLYDDAGIDVEEFKSEEDKEPEEDEESEDEDLGHRHRPSHDDFMAGLDDEDDDSDSEDDDEDEIPEQ